MSSDGFKQALFSQFARIGKALSNGNRLELLEFIAQAERNVDQLASISGLSVANTSQHLRHLKQAGLVTCRKQGLKVYYQLSGDDVLLLLDALRSSAERHLAEVKQLVQTYLARRDDLEPVAHAELLQRARDGLVTVLDVRPKEEFDAGHVAGAINVPLQALETYLQRLDPEQEIVAYCRGPHCILAFEAVAQLRDKGFKAKRLEDGFPEWQLGGWPVDVGPDHE